MLEAAGIKDVLTKAHGSSNPVNVVRATIKALRGTRVRWTPFRAAPRHRRRSAARLLRKAPLQSCPTGSRNSGPSVASGGRVAEVARRTVAAAEGVRTREQLRSSTAAPSK